MNHVKLLTYFKIDTNIVYKNISKFEHLKSENLKPKSKMFPNLKLSES